jgi:magnesium chelatase accessory protein
MNWEKDGADWPNRATSHFIRAGHLTWHVQIMGAGPTLLLAHGTGAATHSWRALMPALAQHFTVIAPDLPGHGFTSAPPPYRMTLNDMAKSLATLLTELRAQPQIAVGHSAGAAILTRMALDGSITPKSIVALNGALLPIPGVTGHIFSGMAKMLALVPAIPWLFAWRAGDPAAVQNLIASTGSQLDPAGIELYGRLLKDSAHVGNVLAMMAGWELEPFAAQLPSLQTPLTLIHAQNDKAVPLKVANKVKALLPGTKIVLQPGLGHLSHEEAPEETADLIRKECLLF